tara:strand:+ start:487 stop:660 length:174 start_codon:yes stop_codon:yes gene_type:complete
MGRKITLEILVEGPGGQLMFVPISKTKKEIKGILEQEKNPMIAHNIKKQLKDQRVKL